MWSSNRLVNLNCASFPAHLNACRLSPALNRLAKRQFASPCCLSTSFRSSVKPDNSCCIWSSSIAEKVGLALPVAVHNTPRVILTRIPQPYIQAQMRNNTCTTHACRLRYASIFCWEHIFCLIRSSNDRKMYMERY